MNAKRNRQGMRFKHRDVLISMHVTEFRVYLVNCWVHSGVYFHSRMNRLGWSSKVFSKARITGNIDHEEHAKVHDFMDDIAAGAMGKLLGDNLTGAEMFELLPDGMDCWWRKLAARDLRSRRAHPFGVKQPALQEIIKRELENDSAN